MPFDALTMASVADDVRARAVEGRIQRIIQPSLHSVALSIYAGGEQRWLLCSADARHARVHLVEGSLAKAFPTPSSFVMLLRKYLEGARLLEAMQQPYERVLLLSAPRARLAVEVMGKHSNIVLIGEDGTILGAVKNVPPRESRVRPVLPGLRYSPPPEQERNVDLYGAGPRLDPALSRDGVTRALGALPPDTPLRSALLGLLPGCGPFLADEIAVRAGALPGGVVGDADRAGLLSAAAGLYELYATHAWTPVTFLDSRARPDFAPYRPASFPEAREEPSISAAIERVTGAFEIRDVLATIRSEVLAEVERKARSAQRRVHSLYAGLEAAEEADTVMQSGQLLLAYQYLAEPNATQLVIPDLEMTIPLDPRLTPRENADRLFKRYRKLRDAQERLPGLIEAAEREAAELEDLAAFVRLAGSESDLRALQRDLKEEGGRAKEKPPKAGKRRGPPRFTRGGYIATVGRSARENEEVTFRLGRREDLWLHARERTGAHVVLQGPDTPPDELLQAAAALAAYHSEGRSDTAVDVDVAAVRDVRKIPNGPPGRVTYRNFRTVRVAPSVAGWEAL